MMNEDQEMVDVVNENDEVTDTVAKDEAHAKGLLHRTVIAELVNSKGQYVLVKQAADRQDPGQFVSPVGGHVRAGETNEQAVRREAEEEIGLTNFSTKYIGKAIFNRTVNSKKENHYFILYEIYSDENPILNHESVGYEYFTKEQLSDELKKTPRKFGEAYHFIVRTFYPQLLEEKKEI